MEDSDYTLDSDPELYYRNYYHLRGGTRWPPPILSGRKDGGMLPPKYPIKLKLWLPAPEVPTRPKEGE